MKLVYTTGVNKGKEVQVGDRVRREDGTLVKVAYFRPPHKPSSSGKVSVNFIGESNGVELVDPSQCEYYVSVIGAEWIERENRGEVPVVKPPKVLNEKCFWVPGNNNIIDTVTAKGKGTYSGETLEQVQLRHPGAILTDLDTASDAITKQNITPPQEITRERYEEMLEVLPPEGWVNHGGTESFKLMEYTCGIVTQIFARVGTKFYEMQDKATLKHEEIIKKICG